MEFAALYARHHDALYRFCLRRVHDRQLVEDIVHDVFEKAFAGRSRYDPRREFWPWLASIAARACIDARRRSASAQARHDRYARETYRKPFDATATAALRVLGHRHLREQLSELPARQRTALRLYALDGWSYEQIARYLGSSTTAVKALIRRARSTLRETTSHWAGVALGIGRAARGRFRRGVARVQSTVWPSVDILGTSVVNLLAGGSSAAVALVAVCGGLTPLDAGGPPGTASGYVARAGLVVPDPAGVGTAGSPAPGRDRGGNPGARQPLTGRAERTGNELVASLLPGDAGSATPESIHAQSFATSPDYDDDPTVFLAGALAGRLEGVAVPLLVSHDGGASWTRLRAVGLAPVTRILLPPAYPRDGRVFAVTAKGLQASYDGGDTFVTLVTMPQITDIALSPAFEHDPTVLLVAGGRLWRYADDTGLVTSVEVRGGPAAHVVVSVGYAGGPDAHRPVFLGSRLPDVVFGDSGLHISRCSMDVLSPAVSVPRIDCESVKLPSVPADELPLRLSSTFRAGLLYVPNPLYPFVSRDGGRSFQPARQSWDASDYAYRIYDLAPAPGPTGESAVVAQLTQKLRSNWPVYGAQLARTDDGGRTWTPIPIDLPDFWWAQRVTVTPTGRIIAGSGLGGIACSEDGGRTWARTCPTPEAA